MAPRVTRKNAQLEKYGFKQNYIVKIKSSAVWDERVRKNIADHRTLKKQKKNKIPKPSRISGRRNTVATTSSAYNEAQKNEQQTVQIRSTSQNSFASSIQSRRKSVSFCDTATVYDSTNVSKKNIPFNQNGRPRKVPVKFDSGTNSSLLNGVNNIVIAQDNNNDEIENNQQSVSPFLETNDIEISGENDINIIQSHQQSVSPVAEANNIDISEEDGINITKNQQQSVPLAVEAGGTNIIENNDISIKNNQQPEDTTDWFMEDLFGHHSEHNNIMLQSNQYSISLLATKSLLADSDSLLGTQSKQQNLVYDGSMGHSSKNLRAIPALLPISNSFNVTQLKQYSGIKILANIKPPKGKQRTQIGKWIVDRLDIYENRENQLPSKSVDKDEVNVQTDSDIESCFGEIEWDSI